MKELIRQLFIKLNVPFTSKLDNLSISVNNLSDFSQLCDLYSVSNMPVRLDSSLLSEMPFPAIVVFPREDIKFGILEGYENELLNISNGKNTVRVSLGELYQAGSGAALLLTSDELSREPKYDENVEKQTNKSTETFIAYSALLVFGLFFAYQAFSLSLVTGLLVLSNALGLGISLLLLNKEHHNSSDFVDRICKVNKDTDCNDVIHSEKSKIFKWLSWADIGVIYFSGNLLTLLVNKNDAVVNIAILTILSLPLTIVSVYFQGRILKKWCVLCLFVLVVLWLNALTLYSNNNLWENIALVNFKLSVIFTNLIIFLLPMAILLPIKSYLRQNTELNILTGRLNNWEKNSDLFISYINAKPAVKIEPWVGEIIQGNTNVPINITIVSNPFCEPCKVAHNELEKLGHYFSEEICIFYRFMVDWENDSKNDVIKYLLQIPVDKKLKALHRWYQLLNFDSWQKEYPLIDEMNNDIFIHHVNWVFDADIKYTPSIFINGVLIEQPYNAESLSLHIRSVLETLPE